MSKFRFQTSYIVIPLIVFAVGYIGSIATSRNMDWYATIAKPDFTPPGSVIGGVWTLLFTMCAISAIRVWNRWTRDQGFKQTIEAFWANAAINSSWSWVFFGFHQIGWAVVVCAMLANSVLWLIILIKPRDTLAAWLLVPYLLWVMFATYLNFTIWQFNHI